MSEEQYRDVRHGLLYALTMVVKVKFPEASDIVGIATEPGAGRVRSEDVLFLDAREWSPEHQAEAEKIQKDFQLFTKVVRRERPTEYEFPRLHERGRAVPAAKQAHRKGSIRNSLCPCGSGKKVKRCCGPKRGM
jgi:hypothetical protein